MHVRTYACRPVSCQAATSIVNKTHAPATCSKTATSPFCKWRKGMLATWIMQIFSRRFVTRTSPVEISCCKRLHTDLLSNVPFVAVDTHGDKKSHESNNGQTTGQTCPRIRPPSCNVVLLPNKGGAGQGYEWRTTCVARGVPQLANFPVGQLERRFADYFRINSVLEPA